jgi:MurNAc alpha-1-phosphate uridylyltransferase
MRAMPEAAMVLAAGLGTRMRPLTDQLPKPLVPVAGKALIDYALDRFAEAGVARAVVNVHYRADQIETHVAGRARPRILISDERGELLETGGGVKKALPLLDADAFFCTNTDAILIDEGVEACRALGDAFDDDTDALLLLAPIERASGYDGAGDFDLAPDGAVAFRSGASAPFVFTGLQILRAHLFRDAPLGAFSTRLVWTEAMKRGRMRGVAHVGRWMHVGDPEGLAAAEAILRSPPGR